MDHKTVLIVGGSSGIGLATAQRFAAEGWSVLIAAPGAQAAQTAVETLAPGEHLAIDVDITRPDQVAAMARKIQSRYGQIDALVNSAGVSKSHDAIHSDFAAWDRQLQVMLYGAVAICRAVTPLMRDGGRIIHVTSIHHERIARGSSSYGMAKAAVTQYTRSLALELADRKILVNAVAPGFVDTPMSIKEDGRNELKDEQFINTYVKGDRLPLRRAAEPREIAGVIWFLAGPDATYLTGSIITVDGGLSITF